MHSPACHFNLLLTDLLLTKLRCSFSLRLLFGVSVETLLTPAPQGAVSRDRIWNELAQMGQTGCFETSVVFYHSFCVKSGKIAYLFTPAWKADITTGSNFS